MKFDEGKQYYVRRIDFSGNSTTRDKVIRRQLLIDEGQLFNKRAWELSVLRINQLDYFNKLDADKAVEIKRNQNTGSVDLLLKLQETGKQSIGLQGGVRGLAGGFIGLTYQTNTFLGLGETLTLSAQIGQYQRNLMFGFTEPYLFDRPISSGFTIFSTLYKFNQAQQAAQLTGQQVSINPQFIQDYNQNSTGFTTFANYALKKHVFTRVGLTYGLTRTNISTYNQSSELLFTQLQYGSLAGPSALNGIIASTVTGTISYNTIDNPINATHGKSYFYSLSFTGGPIGGDTQGVMNLEYRIPIAGPVAMSLFNDIGTVGVLRKGGLLLSSTGIDNINNLFPLANQRAQLQIAPGTNFKLRDSAGIEFIVNLPIVQAPFRIYYSYNPLPIHQTLYAPNP